MGGDRERAAFVKRRSDAPAGFFAWEAAGLGWLAQAAGAGGVPIVRVREVGAQQIVLDRVDEAPATAAAAAAFGRALCRTHASAAPAFGSAPPGWLGDGFIGRQGLVLQAFPTWGAFYGQTRLRPFAQAAVRGGTLSAADADRVERVCERLGAGDFDDGRPPARIHGDLWGGNVLYSAGTRNAAGAVLIDPAAHGGHGLTDLAMLALFGTEHLERVLAAYAEAAGLAAGWRDLIGLHQLHPLLVHAVSHGASYGRQAGLVAERYL